MKLNEIYQAIEDLKNSLPKVFHGTEISYPFKNRLTPIGDWSDLENIGMIVTGDDIGKKSGVYFFAKPNEEVFYIGKAACLHERVWKHVNTPTTNEDGKKLFPNHNFRCDESTEEMKLVAKGQALLGVATVSNPNLVSLIEVYLQTIHINKHGKLPIINKQIG